MWTSSLPSQPFTGTNKDDDHLNLPNDLESQVGPPPRHVTFKGRPAQTAAQLRSRTDEENAFPKSAVEEERRGSGADSEVSKEHVGGGLSERVTWKDRLQLFTWNWFTMVMATGGIANAINSIPFKFKGLTTIGNAFLILTIILFITCCILITIRFCSRPGSFKQSFLEPSESLFIPASVVSCGVMLMAFAKYGVPSSGKWLQTGLEVCFWVYAAMAFLSSCAIYVILWSTQQFSLRDMTPIWVFPVYPLLIVAPLAASLINSVPTQTDTLRISSKTIIVGAITLQGTGFLVSALIYSAYLYRLMTNGLPSSRQLPSMFVSVGPAGFTATGVIQLGTLASKAIPVTKVGSAETVSVIVRVLAYAVGLVIWGFAIWFFVLSVFGQWSLLLDRRRNSSYHQNKNEHKNKNENGRIKFDVTFFAYVFPNSALVSATHMVGRAFENDVVEILGTVFGVTLILVWVVVFGKTVWVVWRKRLLWPAEKEV
ncbi:voltage-dependent anion channel-domain-containing protein [Rhexocercosporidium sp. MPI-PUGE-AT-0058]|nr:voltage-dependent anion channel-domain-containing protein [Rhexocercosporidium sp. MPI-PUGE-AT-0058]